MISVLKQFMLIKAYLFDMFKKDSIQYMLNLRFSKQFMTLQPNKQSQRNREAQQVASLSDYRSTVTENSRIKCQNTDLPFDLQPIKPDQIEMFKEQHITQQKKRKQAWLQQQLKKQLPRPKIHNIFVRIKIQRMVKYWIKRVKKSKHRLMVLKQWEKTQTSYIKDLQLIQQKIHKPLVQLKLITFDQQKILFPNLDAMKRLSMQLHQDIQRFIEQWHPIKTLIGSKLIYFHKFFMIYRDYCNNFYRGLAIVKNLKKKQQVKQIQRKLPMDLQSFLIKPVQRPPKYQLLLRQYQKAIPKDHSDFNALTEAIQKYHQVNQQNNKSMENQMKNEKLIKLQQKHGNILKNSRLYISQFIALTLELKVKLYLFNDMVMVVLGKGKSNTDEQWDQQEIYKKIYLDGKSFVDPLMDCKYFVNRLFLSGKKQNIHLHFYNKIDRDTLFESLKNIIMQLYKKEVQRKVLMNEVQTRKKNFIRVRVTVTEETLPEVIYLTNLKIIVAGVQKRPISAVRTQTYYILKIQTPYPDIITQYTYLNWDELFELQRFLLQQNNHMYLPQLDAKPQSMNYYDIKKNKSKIIEYRSIHIQRFLNYIIRSEDVMNKAQEIRKRIRINRWLWKYATSNNQDKECFCKFCMKMNNTQSIKMKEIMKQRQIIQDQLKKIRISKTASEDSYNEKNKNRIETDDQGCIFWAFKTMQLVTKLQAKQFQTLQDRLIWIDYSMGRVDYSLIRLPPTNKLITINIYLPNIGQNDQYLEIEIGQESLVYDVMQAIGQKVGMKTMRDYGLFLEYYQVPRLLDTDQNIQQALTEVLTYSEKQEGSQSGQTNQSRNQNLGFMNKISRSIQIFKKTVQQFVVGKKSRLVLKKYICLDPHIEFQACISNPIRAQLVVKEMFYQYKQQQIILSYKNSIILCALYYIIVEVNNLESLSKDNFKKNKLQCIIPQSKSPSVRQRTINVIKQNLQGKTTFEDQVFQEIIKLRSQLKPKKDSMDKVVHRILEMVTDQLSWSCLLFEVSNYEPSSLPGKSIELLAGINYKNFVIIRRKQLVPLLEIPLVQLNYKVTPFSLFIKANQKQYRFDGKMMYDIKKMIEAFKGYALKFGASH